MNDPRAFTHLGQLRELVKTKISRFYDTDFNLNRWLIATNNDVELAAKRLRNHLEFRSAMNLDRPTEKLKEELMANFNFLPKCFTRLTTGADPSLLCVLPIGLVDAFGILHAIPSGKFYAGCIFYGEILLRSIMEKEAEFDQQIAITFVFDAEGVKPDFWTSTAAETFFKSAAILICDQYVEIAKRILVLNAKYSFQLVRQIIEPILPERTAQKFLILQFIWSENVFKFVSVDHLPSEYGGKFVVDRHRDFLDVIKPSPIQQNLLSIFKHKQVCKTNKKIFRAKKFCAPNGNRTQPRLRLGSQS